MPESSPELTKDPADLTAADLEAMQPPNTEPDPADDAEDDESLDFTIEEDAPEDEPEAKPTEEDDEEFSEDWNPDEKPVTTKYAFDETVLEGIPKDQADRIKRRWSEQTAGIEKREAQLADVEGRLETLDSWEKGLSDPRTAREAYEELGRRLTETHKWQTNATVSESDESDDVLTEWERRIEAKVAERYESRLKAIEDRTNQENEQREFARYVERTYPTVKKAIQKMDGVEITRQEFIESVTNLPSLKSTPIKAVRKWQGDKIADSKTRNVAARKRAPDMVASGTRPEPKGKDPADLTYADMLAMNRK